MNLKNRELNYIWSYFFSTETLPLVIILIGSTSGIIVFSAFVILLVLCHRRRRKGGRINEKPDVTVTTSDMYKESDRSSNISDLKLQLPQSDGSYDLVSIICNGLKSSIDFFLLIIIRSFGKRL